MIKIAKTERGYGPVLMCDVCKERIVDARLAAAVSRTDMKVVGEITDVLYAHKGTCHDHAEKSLDNGDGDVGWEELSRHLSQVIHNGGLTLGGLAALDKKDAEIGY